MEEVRVLDKDSHGTRKGWLPWTSKVSQGLLALNEGIGACKGCLPWTSGSGARKGC